MSNDLSTSTNEISSIVVRLGETYSDRQLRSWRNGSPGGQAVSHGNAG
jgi:hypothetical protein